MVTVEPTGGRKFDKRHAPWSERFDITASRVTSSKANRQTKSAFARKNILKFITLVVAATVFPQAYMWLIALSEGMEKTLAVSAYAHIKI
jgi:hypothetical protein